MEQYQTQLNIRQETPAYWHNKSHDLFVSARTLWKAIKVEANFLAAYKMLMRMSIKLLFKANCVGAGIIFNITHDLMVLAKT